jgi:hypothetical protein
MSASWASHVYTAEMCGCVEKAGFGGHGTHKSLAAVRSYWESTATQSIAHAVRIENSLSQ